MSMMGNIAQAAYVEMLLKYIEDLEEIGADHYEILRLLRKKLIEDKKAMDTGWF